MARENTSRYAVLGMLTHGAQTGYDLKRAIGGSVRHFWSESYGQVYPTLKELVNEGLATVVVESGNIRPDRKVYTVTDAGIEELRHWLVKPVELQPSRNELLLKLFFGRYVPAQELVEVVSKFRERWVEDVAEWADIQDRLRDNMENDLDLRNRLFTLEYGRIVGEATIHWADEVIAALVGTTGTEQESSS